MERLKHMPFEDIGFAKVDHHRALRQGFAEVVFGKGKTPKQVAEIVRAMVEKKASRQNVLVTRADEKMFAAVKQGAAAGKDLRTVYKETYRAALPFRPPTPTGSVATPLIGVCSLNLVGRPRFELAVDGGVV